MAGKSREKKLMILKEGKNVTLKVGEGIYFPDKMKASALAYQLVNNKTGVVEFEEVQLAACWEAFGHFEEALNAIYDEIEGRTAPTLEIVPASALSDIEPTTH